MKFYLIFFLCALTSCTKTSPWPIHGAGGYAKYQYLEDEQIEVLMRRLRRVEVCGAKQFAALEFQEAGVSAIYLRRSHVTKDNYVAQNEYKKLTLLVHKIEERIKIYQCRVK